MQMTELSVLFLADLFLIVVSARVFGWVAQRFLRQPRVVGEMVAGITLGPSFLGIILPDLHATLFPDSAKSILYVFAQLGVGLFMFLVGLTFSRSHFRANIRSAGYISFSGIAAPLLMAALITPWLIGKPGLFPAGVTRYEATLFMIACISVTAFPVLARIIHERGLGNSEIGALSLAAGALDDAAAWIMLAFVLSFVGDDSSAVFKLIVGGGLFAALLLTVGPKFLKPFGRNAGRGSSLSEGKLAATIALFLLAAAAMDWAGLHAVFGGFVLGLAMPRGPFALALKDQLEPITAVLFLPVFFAFSGLNTRLSIVIDPSLLMVGLLVLFVAIVAKAGACWAGARLAGQDNRSALAIGALMNARGLMELIIINIGLQKGIISEGLFSILVLMTVITTLMAAPMFELVYRDASKVKPHPSGGPRLVDEVSDSL